MSDFFLDASAIVKRYADEAGSAWVRQITNPDVGNTIVLSEITLAEVSAALAAKQRAPKGITVDERDCVLGRFFQDCDEHFTLISIGRAIIDRAVELTQRHRLRAYDALQLATALDASGIMQAQGLSPLTFVALPLQALPPLRLRLSLPTRKCQRRCVHRRGGLSDHTRAQNFNAVPTIPIRVVARIGPRLRSCHKWTESRKTCA